MATSATDRIRRTSVASVYVHYVAKAEKKGRGQAEVDEVSMGKAMEKVLRGS